MTFDITIPVLNEEETLEKQIKTLHNYISNEYPDLSLWKIIIADNGSTDETENIGRKLEKELGNIFFLKVPRRGVGLALKTSWGQSDADIVGYMDLDLATYLVHFKEAIDALQGDFDIVYGSRLHKDSTVINRTLKRELASRVFNKLLKSYLKVEFSDGMCGFKWLKREKLGPLMEAGATNDGWFFSTELLTTAEWLEYKLFELPVKWTDDVSSSKVRILPLAKDYIRSMIELKKLKP